MNIATYHFLRKLKKIPSIENIWVYGSRARSDQQERSDIDLAITAPTATAKEWNEIQAIIDNADTLLKIDCVRQDILPDSKFKQNILKHKKILYQKGTNYMDKIFWKDYFESLGNALNKLGEVLEHPELGKMDILRDAAIQRFEFCIELYWKVLKKFLAYEKIETTTPRDVLNKAYQYKFINDEPIWLAMMDDRNQTSHEYKEEAAIQIYEHIKGYWPILRDTYASLKQKF